MVFTDYLFNNRNSYSYAKEPHTVKPRFYWAACAVLLAACSPEPTAEKTVSAASQTASAATLTVPTARGDAVVPKNPERIAVYDWAALDTLTELGVNVGAT